MKADRASKPGRWIGVLLFVLAMLFGFMYWPALWVEFRIRQEPGLTRLNEAVKLDSKGLVKWLLERGDDPNAGDIHNAYPVWIAEDKEMILLLMKAGAEGDLWSSVAEDNVPMVKACLEFHWEQLREMPVDEEDRDWIVMERREMLARARSVEMVRALAPLGSDPHLALRDHVQRGVPEVIEELLLMGADVSDPYYSDRTLLHADPSPAGVETLVKHGADVHAITGKEGYTALHLVRHQGAVRGLIAAGANVNAVDFKGRTPLHRAGDRRCAELLVEHGADPFAPDLEGKTPLHTNQREGVLVYLLSLPGVLEKAASAAEENDVLGELISDKDYLELL